MTEPKPSVFESHPDLTLCDSGTLYHGTVHCCELFTGHELPHMCAHPDNLHQVIKWVPTLATPSAKFRLSLEALCLLVLLFSVLATVPGLAFLACFGMVAIHLLLKDS